MKYSTANYLMHYGVTGQKWGVRRYQNPDGSLTPEGRQHYGLGDLDYNARYSGDKKSAKKALKAERKTLRNKVFDAYDIDEKEWDDDLTNLDKDENIGDHHEHRNAEKELMETSDQMYSTYKAGLKEVDRYLAGKYGQETFDSFKSGEKAKKIAIGASVVAGSTILGAGVWYGTKTHKNNELRKSEDAYYEQAKNSREDYEKAVQNRQFARSDEFFAKQERDIASRKFMNSHPDNKESHRTVYQLYEKDYQNKKEAAEKAAKHLEETRNRSIRDSDRYHKAAYERAQKTSGPLWKRKSDNERDDRYIEFMKGRK